MKNNYSQVINTLMHDLNNNPNKDYLERKLKTKSPYVIMEFVKWLDKNNFELNYQNISTLFRYDKRINKIIINISGGLEQTLRGLCEFINLEEDKVLKSKYNECFGHETNFEKLKDQLVNLGVFSSGDLGNVESIRELRNMSHHYKYYLIDNNLNRLLQNLKHIDLIENKNDLNIYDDIVPFTLSAIRNISKSLLKDKQVNKKIIKLLDGYLKNEINKKIGK